MHSIIIATTLCIGGCDLVFAYAAATDRADAGRHDAPAVLDGPRIDRGPDISSADVPQPVVGPADAQPDVSPADAQPDVGPADAQPDVGPADAQLLDVGPADAQPDVGAPQCTVWSVWDCFLPGGSYDCYATCGTYHLSCYSSIGCECYQNQVPIKGNCNGNGTGCSRCESALLNGCCGF